jgi:hypothetical protein
MKQGPAFISYGDYWHNHYSMHDRVAKGQINADIESLSHAPISAVFRALFATKF